jgi:hypothetical protein
MPGSLIAAAFFEAGTAAFAVTAFAKVVLAFVFHQAKKSLFDQTTV